MGCCCSVDCTLSNWVPDFGANIDITFFKGTEIKEMKNKIKKYYKENTESGLLTSECKFLNKTFNASTFCCVLSRFYYHPWHLASLFQQNLILYWFLLKPFKRSVLIEITKITHCIHPPWHLYNHFFLSFQTTTSSSIQWFLESTKICQCCEGCSC